jgi:hypothetical protein
VDVESELIRSGNWPELRRHYTKKIGSSWELGWMALLQERSRSGAIEHFKNALRDPHFEEASYLLLRKLGVQRLDRPANLPNSLKLFDSFVAGELRPLVVFLCTRKEHLGFAESILSQVDQLHRSVREEELRALDKVERLSARALIYVSLLWDRRLKKPQEALRVFEYALRDPGFRRLTQSLAEWIDDEVLLSKILGAYHHRDGLSLGRYLTALIDGLHEGRIGKSLHQDLRATLVDAFRFDHEHMTENLLSFSFWKDSLLSPRALLSLDRQQNNRVLAEPNFLHWQSFFESSDDPRDWSLSCLQDDASLPCWQILVELRPDTLSEALLKFPTQERFLLLWSARSDVQSSENHKRWPKDLKESEVVRANLRRAFERASNKELWFDRIRKAGCSQDLYDFVLTQITPPLEWILADLESGMVQNSPSVRRYVVTHLSITAPQASGAHELQVGQISKLLTVLTPAERQEVLLSRFVLAPIPAELLNDQNLDLIWEARERVGEEVLRSWHESVAQYLSKKARRDYQERHWLWIKSAWTIDVKYLEIFAPSFQEVSRFPWQEYLQAAKDHEAWALILTCLRYVAEDGLKADWCAQLIESTNDQKLLFAIQSLKDPAKKSGLLALWHFRQQDFKAAFESIEEQLSELAIFNEYPRVLETALSYSQSATAEMQKFTVDRLNHLFHQLLPLGVLNDQLFQKLEALADRAGAPEIAFRWAMHEWLTVNDSERPSLLDRLIGYASRSHKIDELQKLLVLFVYQSAKLDALGMRIVSLLADPGSELKLQHLRSEFIERASAVFPLHEELLKHRAAFDYRAVILWDAFYGRPLEQKAARPEQVSAKAIELWGLTQSFSRSEDFLGLTSLMTSERSGVRVEELEKVVQKQLKRFGIREEVQIFSEPSSAKKIRILIDPYGLQIDSDYLSRLDESMIQALICGLAQMIQDRDRGLFRNDLLIERFLQGMLLAPLGVKRWIQFAMRLAIQEGLASASLTETNPESLLKNARFLGHLLVFFLGRDYASKLETCGLSF